MTEPATQTPGIRELGKSLFSKIAREHPTLLLTLIYLALTFVGMIHDLWFYLYFKINILDYSETSDFLLAAIRNPLVIILSILPLGLAFLVQRSTEAVRRRAKDWEEKERKRRASVWYSAPARAVGTFLFVIVYATLFTQIYAFWEATRVKEGKAGRRVSFMRSDGIISDEQPVLLGTTGKWILLYYRSRKATEIVPIDNTAAITVDSRRRKEREADSLRRADTVIRQAPEDSGSTEDNP